MRAVLVGLAAACASAPPPPPTVEPDAVMAAHAEWKKVYDRTSVSEDVAQAFSDIGSDITVMVVFGDWCVDSRREVPAYWRVMDVAEPRFRSTYVPVDRTKVARGLRDIRYVPTFLVFKDGREVGRLVESPETELFADLIALMRGARSGVISGRDDLD